jgi:hypothetical protein
VINLLYIKMKCDCCGRMVDVNKTKFIVAVNVNDEANPKETFDGRVCETCRPQFQDIGEVIE